MAKTYALKHRERTDVVAPVLDEQQQAVVDHRGGPLLVLAGPGTGKTTTIVEAVAQRILNQELEAEQVLLLTFSRKAADEMRTRVAARVGGAHLAVPAMTFHSYSYALVREFDSAEGYEDPARLITSQERDHVLRDLIGGHPAASWPAFLHQALGTRGFIEEVQSFMDRASALDLGADELRQLAEANDRPEWARMADLVEEYRDVLALRNLVDYPGLIDRAVGIASDDDNRAQLRDRHRLVIVDEYQDTDAMQVRLLQEIAGDGAELIVVGDPDQSIYAFRGADQREILNFTHTFAAAGKQPEVIALRNTRRFGETIMKAAKRTLAGLPLPLGQLSEHMLVHRNLNTLAEDPGRVVLQTYASPTAESECIAGILRSAHLDEGTPWNQMAVLVRNEADVKRLARALTASGVPNETAGDEVPLYDEAAVRNLLAALEVSDKIARGTEISHEAAVAVMDGPLGGLDAAARRRLGRALRQQHPDTRSDVLIAKCLSEPTLVGVSGGDSATRDAVRRTKKLLELLHRAAKDLSKHAPLEQVVWLLWDGSGWTRTLRARWEQGGERRITANRDLDAVTALFDYLTKAEEQGRQRNVANLIDELKAHQIPADRIGSAALGLASVRLMTAHRAKGLEWPLVLVAGVQEGTWPNVRHAGSILRTEELDEQIAATAGAQLREERRLFYVACTRATSQLFVTAVDPINDDSEGPSRFFTELATEFHGDSKIVRQGRPPQAFTLRGVISRLRSVGENPEHSTEDRAEAARLLAQIAQRDVYSAKAADPGRWWVLAGWTQSELPTRAEGDQIFLSATAVESIGECPLRWYLSREVKAIHGQNNAAGVGSIVHAIAKDLADRTLDPETDAPDFDTMVGHLQEVWPKLEHESDWQSERELERVTAMIERLDLWQKADMRTLVAAEYPIEVALDPHDDSVQLIGSIDRLEQHLESSALQVVDFKTGKSYPSGQEIKEHAQLGFYQIAIDRGAAAGLEIDGVPVGDAPVGGAELVHLAVQKGTKDPTLPRVSQQEALNEESLALVQIRDAVDVIRSEQHPATPCSACAYCDFRRVCPTTSEPTIGGQA